MENGVHQEIRKFVIDFFLFGQDGGLTNEESLLEKGIIDSTGVLELVAYLEKTFAIKVHDAELLPENLDSINAIVAFLQRKNQKPVSA
jgi:acyl carrier protein